MHSDSPHARVLEPRRKTRLSAAVKGLRSIRLPASHTAPTHAPGLDDTKKTVKTPAFEPDYVICQGFGADTLQHVMRRLLPNPPTVLLRLDEIPSPLLVLHSVILRGVDLILVPGISEAWTLQSAGVIDARIVLMSPQNDLRLFMEEAHVPGNDAVTRLVHVGALRPEAGTTDLLDGLQRWAVAHPDRSINITWAGDGCMRGILEAQPAPSNLRQYFAGEMSRPQLASLFRNSDLLVTPALPCELSQVVLEAMAAGLPVLGSKRCAVLRELITEGETGWSFDPLAPGGVAGAVQRALASPRVILHDMGAKAAAAARHAAAWTLDARIQNALRRRETRSIITLQSAYAR